MSVAQKEVELVHNGAGGRGIGRVFLFASQARSRPAISRRIRGVRSSMVIVSPGLGMTTSTSVVVSLSSRATTVVHPHVAPSDGERIPGTATHRFTNCVAERNRSGPCPQGAGTAECPLSGIAQRGKSNVGERTVVPGQRGRRAGAIQELVDQHEVPRLEDVHHRTAGI